MLPRLRTFGLAVPLALATFATENTAHAEGEGEAATSVLRGLTEVAAPWKAGAGPNATVLVCLAYIVLIAGVRWYMIARPFRKMLEAHIETDLVSAKGGGSDPTIAEARALLESAQKGIEPEGGIHEIWYAVTWSGAAELSSWRKVFAAERTLAQKWPFEEVRARLLGACEELSGSQDAEASKLTGAIEEALAANPTNEKRCRALLRNALRTIHGGQLQRTTELHTWQNKTMLMIGIALLLVMIIVASLGKPALLLTGALGGFLSRLGKIMKADKIPTDYGAYWTTIFLSPLLGALAGWGGILLVKFAVECGVLGDSFSFVRWSSGWGEPGTLGLAFMLGFSERFLNSLATNIEGKPGSNSGKPEGHVGGNSEEESVGAAGIVENEDPAAGNKAERGILESARAKEGIEGGSGVNAGDVPEEGEKPKS